MSFSEDEPVNPLGVLAFRFALALILVRFGMIHYWLAQVTQTRLLLVPILLAISLLGLFLSGGIVRAFSGRPAWYWTGYTFWVCAASVFSTWPGGSVPIAFVFVRAEYPMLWVMAGMATSWNECRSMLHVIAWGAVASVAAAAFFERMVGGRLSLEAGSMSNANDYAAHLLLVLPFLLFVAFAARNRVMRWLATAVVMVGIGVILRTGSRGGLVALGACLLLFLLRAPLRRRLALIAMVPILLVTLVAVLPRETWKRLMIFSTEVRSSEDEAQASLSTRKRILRQSIVDTIQRPVFGLGPDQFRWFQGNLRHLRGGTWFETHNTYTQASSECGIPALLLLLAGAISSFLLCSSVLKEASRRPDCNDIRDAAFCVMLSLVGFHTAIFFLSLAYVFYLPALGGLAVCLHRVAGREMEKRAALQPAAPPPWGLAPAWRAGAAAGR